MIKSKHMLTIGVAAALGLAACGSDEASNDTTAPAGTTASGGTTAPAGTTAVDGTTASVDSAAPGATTGGTDGGETPTAPEDAGDICEVTDTGGVDDKGFNQISFEGAERAADDFGISADVLESASDADFETNIQSFLGQDCGLIVTVGFLLGDATQAAAEANPDQEFAIVDFAYEEPIPNVRTLTFDMVPASFLAGYLAAGVTESGTVATYGGINIPTVTTFMDGYVKGVDYYNEQKSTDVKVLGWDPDTQEGTFAGNFENLDDGKQLTSSFADEGADIVFPVAGPLGLGSASFATDSGSMRIIGVDSDQYDANPTDQQVYLTSVLKNIDAAVYAASESIIVDGEQGGQYLGTLDNGGTGLAPYHDQDGDVSDELKQEVMDLQDALIAGDVTIE